MHLALICKAKDPHLSQVGAQRAFHESLPSEKGTQGYLSHKNLHHPLAPSRALGIVSLQSPKGRRFHMSEALL